MCLFESARQFRLVNHRQGEELLFAFLMFHVFSAIDILVGCYLFDTVLGNVGNLIPCILVLVNFVILVADARSDPNVLDVAGKRKSVAVGLIDGLQKFSFAHLLLLTLNHDMRRQTHLVVIHHDVGFLDVTAHRDRNELADATLWVMIVQNQLEEGNSLHLLLRIVIVTFLLLIDIRAFICQR